jgi:DNA invertase Pin-like site-specific DNA recombinase
MTWWEKKKKKSRRALAYYRHSAQNRQKNSIEIPRRQVREFAERNNIEIVCEYSDAGVSGLTANRPGFQKLLAHVQRSNKGKKKDLDKVLCLDVSRWGRFQKTDESGYYETLCAENGVKVIYIAHGDLKEDKEDDNDDSFDDLAEDLGKPLDRVLAKRHSKELSKKVLRGTKKVSEDGYRAGAPAPYGTIRIEINDKGVAIGTMKPKQYKSNPNHRVKLTPDEGGNATVVRDIFDHFVSMGHTEKQIAALLSERNIPTPGEQNTEASDKQNISASEKSKWGAGTIRYILQNEQYAGSVVYNKTSSKLKTKLVHNLRKDWIVKPNCYEPVIDRKIFDEAQEIFNIRNKRMSREEMLERIRFAFEKYNMLSYSLMKSLPDMPTRNEIIKAFGSLPEAFQSLYPDVLQKIRGDVKTMIESKAKEVIEYDGFLIINKKFSVKIEPAIPFPRGYGFQWFFRIDNRPRVDLTLGVPLRDTKGSRILGYFPFTRTLIDEQQICIADSSAFKIGLYGRVDLSFMFDLIHWTISNNKEPNNEQK